MKHKVNKKGLNKKALATLLAAMLLVGAVPVSAAQVSFAVDGLEEADVGDTINRAGYNMLGMRQVFEMLGADVDWNSVKRCVTATKDGKEVVLYVDTNKAYVDDKEVTLPIGCEIVDGHIYVPVRFVSEAFGYDISWDANTHKVSINTGDNKYVLLDTTPDITNDTIVLSYDEALQMAIDKSSTLKDIDESVAYLDELRSDLGDLIWSLDRQLSQINSNIFNLSQQTNDILAAQLSMQENIGNTIEAARNIKNVEIQKKMVSVNEEMVKDGLEVALRSYVNNINTTQTQIDLLEASVELGKENISNLELKNSLGYESDYDLQTAKNEQSNNESSLEMLKLNLANDKQALKSFLGIDASKDVYVENEVTFDALADVDLEHYILRKRELDPSITTLKNTVTLAEYKERTNAAYDSESTISVRNELNTAKRNLTDGQDTLEKNIRTAYNNIKQLEENNQKLLTSVEQAKATYNSVVASYKSGMATAYQVKQAKLGILSAEKDVEDNALNYDLLTYTFEHPYLLASTSN